MGVIKYLADERFTAVKIKENDLSYQMGQSLGKSVSL
jgi:hypothetical protein